VLQDRASVALRRFLVGDQLPIDPADSPGDPGLLGPSSVSWQLLADPASLVGGVAALLTQTCHPLAVQGVADHSAYRSDPLGRLRRTVQYVTVSTYGSVAEAERAARFVRRAHATVRGTAPDGTPYSADDPHLMTWVHDSLVAGVLASARRFGSHELTDAAADAFVAEQAEIAALLGLSVARTVDELHAELDAFRSELSSTAATRESLRFLARPPLPLAARPAYQAVFWAAVDLLDAEHRGVLELPAARAARTAGTVAATALVRTWRTFLPRSEVRAAASARIAAGAATPDATEHGAMGGDVTGHDATGHDATGHGVTEPGTAHGGAAVPGVQQA
jgi:uncharacterized protein (DUF2236 family)